MCNPYDVVVNAMDDRQLTELLAEMLGLINKAYWDDYIDALYLENTGEWFSPVAYSSDCVMVIKHFIPDYRRVGGHNEISDARFCDVPVKFFVTSPFCIMASEDMLKISRIAAANYLLEKDNG